MSDLTKDDPFLSQVRAALDASVDELDHETKAALLAARGRALSEDRTFTAAKPRHALGRSWWVPAGAFASVAVAIVAVVLLVGQPETHREFNDLDLLASVDGFDLYEELDFYEWLPPDEQAEDISG